MKIHKAIDRDGTALEFWYDTYARVWFVGKVVEGAIETIFDCANRGQLDKNFARDGIREVK